jgi:NADPH-dependent ferric siderophore reductase
MTIPARTTPWEEVPATVESVEPLGSHLIRLVLVGPRLRHLRDDGPDQRLKIVLPDSGVMRALTISELDTAAGRLTLVIVRHEPAGPLGRWLHGARTGDGVVLSAATTRSTEVPAGVDWCPPADLNTLLVVADSTALPAVARILVGLDEHVTGTVLVAVRSAEESMPLHRPRGVRLEWFIDDGNGDWLPRNIVGRLGELDLPGGRRPPNPLDGTFYAWVACESGLVKAVRRHLLGDRGVPRGCVSFMGYWRREREAA